MFSLTSIFYLVFLLIFVLISGTILMFLTKVRNLEDKSFKTAFIVAALTIFFVSAISNSFTFILNKLLENNYGIINFLNMLIYIPSLTEN